MRPALTTVLLVLLLGRRLFLKDLVFPESEGFGLPATVPPVKAADVAPTHRHQVGRQGLVSWTLSGGHLVALPQIQCRGRYPRVERLAKTQLRSLGLPRQARREIRPIVWVLGGCTVAIIVGGALRLLGRSSLPRP